jgi:hypothetical protein
MQELEHLGVGFVSLTDAPDLTTPAGRAMAALLAVFAAFEREILGERVRADLAPILFILDSFCGILYETGGYRWRVRSRNCLRDPGSPTSSVWAN